MSIPRIHIPPDLPEEARRLVEAVNELLREVTEEIRDLNAHPELYTIEQRWDIAERCRIALDRFVQMREDLNGFGLEWSEWPDTIE